MRKILVTGGTNFVSRYTAEFFVKNGIPEGNIKTSGMTPTDIKRAATAAFDNKKKHDNEFVKIQLIITGVTPKENP